MAEVSSVSRLNNTVPKVIHEPDGADIKWFIQAQMTPPLTAKTLWQDAEVIKRFKPKQPCPEHDTKAGW